MGDGAVLVKMDAPVETGDFDGLGEMRNENPPIYSSYILTKPLTLPPPNHKSRRFLPQPITQYIIHKLRSMIGYLQVSIHYQKQKQRNYQLSGTFLETTTLSISTTRTPLKLPPPGPGP
jgi:hypothetical protein